MDIELFKNCVNAVAEYAIEALREEIKEQVDLLTEWDDEYLCNTKVALSHLESILDFVSQFNEESYIDKDLKDCVKMILYEEPYYKFNIPKIIEDADLGIDANEYNKNLFMFLKGKISINEQDEED